MRIYVAGPMRGYPDFNFPAFDRTAEELRALGHEVCNPADRDRWEHGDEVNASPTGDLADIAHTGFDLREALAWDMAWIAEKADAVFMLDGWAGSKGATAERALAIALGLEVFYEIGDPVPPAEPAEEIPAVRLADMEAALSGEVRTTSSTGGQKGVKLAAFDLLPAGPLTQVAEHYGRGAIKYDRDQWRNGYEWSKSFAALHRHAWAFWNGEDIDAETGSHHMAAVAWHALALLDFIERFPQHDDRFKGSSS